MTTERLVKLTDIGFVFSLRPDGFTSWEDRMEQCKQFLAQHGHLQIPKHHPELGSWTQQMRWYYKRNLEGKKSSLTKERQEQLDDMGFVWLVGKRLPTVLNPKTWDERLAEFQDFLKIHGHPFVPQHMEGGLGGWVSRQRYEYNLMTKQRPCNQMTPEKALKLAHAGFAFDASSIRRTPKSALDAASEEKPVNSKKWC